MNIKTKLDYDKRLENAKAILLSIREDLMETMKCTLNKDNDEWRLNAFLTKETIGTALAIGKLQETILRAEEEFAKFMS